MRFDAGRTGAADRILSVEGLKTWFFTPEGVVRAVDGVDLTLDRGGTLGVVGESGCGKTVLALSILRLVADPPGKIVEGRVIFDGQDLVRLDEEGMRRIRGDRISMVFQEPMTSLNPVFTIGSQIAEVFTLHKRARSMREAMPLVEEILDMVGIEDAERMVRSYPHQLSGGMRQRVMIAMAMACRPDLLIADEPTTALDVTTQAQILGLMDDLRARNGTSIVLVTHDLGVVAGFCRDVAVMYTGRVVELSPAPALFANPMHPYTKGLLRSVPRLDAASRKERLCPIEGNVPTFRDMPQGCTFHPRCPEAMDICRGRDPGTYEPEGGRLVRCWRYA